MVKSATSTISKQTHPVFAKKLTSDILRILKNTIIGSINHQELDDNGEYKLVLILMIVNFLIDISGILAGIFIRKLNFVFYKFIYGSFHRLYEISSTHLLFAGLIAYFSDNTIGFVFLTSSTSLIFLPPFILLQSILKIESRIIFATYFFLSSQSIIKSLNISNTLPTLKRTIIRGLIVCMQLIVLTL